MINLISLERKFCPYCRSPDSCNCETLMNKEIIYYLTNQTADFPKFDGEDYSHAYQYRNSFLMHNSIILIMLYHRISYRKFKYNNKELGGIFDLYFENGSVVESFDKNNGDLIEGIYQIRSETSK